MTGLADGVLVLLWIGSLGFAWGRPGRRPKAAFGAGVGIVVLTGAAGAWLEGATGGRIWSTTPGTVLGTLVVVGGAILHANARRALGPRWAPITTPGDTLVTTGPYARRRHPAYVGLLIMALGTVVAHPSVAVGAAAAGLCVGLVLKARLEDHRLEEHFGDRWHRWAAEVPGWVRIGARPPKRPISGR